MSRDKTWRSNSAGLRVARINCPPWPPTSSPARLTLIVISGGTLPALAVKNATSTIPIVFVTGADPVAAGLVASLARPGGNLTGATFISTELMPKRVELLSELVPQAGVIALLVNQTNPIISEPPDPRNARSGAYERDTAPCSEGQHRRRDRRRFRDPRPTASRRASRRPRRVLPHPARAARGTGITPRGSGDVFGARVH